MVKKMFEDYSDNQQELPQPLYCSDCRKTKEITALCIREAINLAVDTGWLVGWASNVGLHVMLCPDCAKKYGSIDEFVFSDGAA